MKLSIAYVKLVLVFVAVNIQFTFSQQSVSWTDMIGLSVIGNNIQKTRATNIWGDAGAASNQVLNSNTDGWVESTVLEVDKARVIGFSELNSDADYTTIDYGLYLRHTGQLQVYEKGVLKFTAANNYLNGDKVKVERVGGIINYIINNNIFYTSTIVSTTSLIVDLSIHHSNGTLNDVLISNSFSNTSASGQWMSSGADLYFENSVAIGRSSVVQDYLLSVEGKIITQEVKVTLDGWSDFVFENNYHLPSLKDVEIHIKENGHLKDIPSAEEVKKKGILLGDMDSKLLQKIEELTLYTIEQQKQIEVLKKENRELRLFSKRLTQIEKILNNKM